MDNCSIAEERSSSQAIDEARILIYRLLSMALGDPKYRRFSGLVDRGFPEVASAAEVFLIEATAADDHILAPGELPATALSSVQQVLELARHPVAEVVEEYDRIFGLVTSKKCPPYESEFCPETFSVYRSQHLADIAGFYRAFGLAPSRNEPERHDHIALELEFMGWLITKELHAGEDEQKAALCRETQKKFLAEHLAWWAPAFAFALTRRAERIGNWQEMTNPAKSFYGAVGRVLSAFIAIERRVLHVPAPKKLVGPQQTDESDPAGCEGCSAAVM